MKNKKLFLILGIIGIVLVLTGVTYSFFNYTREGAANNLGTGTISFLSTQNNTLNLTNLKPMKSENIDPSTLDAVTITVQGATSYDDGEEYLISIAGVNNTINNKIIPIKFIAEVSNTGSIGTSSNDYWNARENTNSSIYLLNSTGNAIDGSQVLVGYIKGGNNGINGSITIKAYIDGDRIAISDTLEDGDIEVNGYENETDSEWVAGRTVFTTTEWNSLQSTPISFRIRAESNEGIWVEEPATPVVCFKTQDAVIYSRNPNMNVNTCVSYLTTMFGEEEEGVTVDVGETYEAFCQGTGTVYGNTFQDLLDNNQFLLEDLAYMEEHNIITNIAEDNTISIVGMKSAYRFNSEITQTSVNTCVNYFTNIHGEEAEGNNVNIGETYEAFCQGTGTIWGNTFQDLLDHVGFSSQDLEYFEEQGVIVLDENLSVCQTTDIVIPSIINEKRVTEIGNNVFQGMGLTSVTIPNSVTTIGTDAFSNNQLTSVTIPNSVTRIKESAFYDNQLTSIVIPNSVTRIEPGAFRKNQLTSVTIPNSVTTIGPYAFSWNQLTSVTIPNSVTRIEPGTFEENQLTSVTIPNSVTYLSGFNGNLFSDFSSIIIPNSVTTIGNAAFSGNQLTNVVIPNSVTRIEGYAFSYNQLTSVTIPNGVTTIGDSAFAENQLANVIFPNSLTTIGPYAFSWNQLTSVTIPNSVTEWYCNAFEDEYVVTINNQSNVTCSSVSGDVN